MTLRLILLVAAGFFIAADDKDDAVKKELKNLEGTWKVVAMERDGKQEPDEVAKAPEFTFKGDKIVFKTGDKEREMTFKIDPTKKPKEIDLGEASAGQVSKGKGIYIFNTEKGELKICVGKRDGDRPTEFATKEGTGVSIITFKRAKP